MLEIDKMQVKVAKARNAVEDVRSQINRVVSEQQRSDLQPLADEIKKWLHETKDQMQ